MVRLTSGANGQGDGGGNCNDSWQQSCCEWSLRRISWPRFYLSKMSDEAQLPAERRPMTEQLYGERAVVVSVG